MPEREKVPLIQAIIGSFATWQEQNDAEEDDEKKWLLQNSTPHLRELLPELSVLMLHVLDRIGQSKQVNGITIAKQMRISKGTVSKITQKLVAYNLIRKESLPYNKKEILFSLTTLGQELFDLHNEMHRQMESNLVLYLQQYDIEKLQIVAGFVHDLAKQSFLHLRPEREPDDSPASE